MILEVIQAQGPALTSQAICQVIDEVKKRTRSLPLYIPIQQILLLLSETVMFKDRASFLDALKDMPSRYDRQGALDGLLIVIRTWENGPAVRQWANRWLPEILVDELPVVAGYLPFDSRLIQEIFRLSAIPDTDLQTRLLAGLERHVDQMGGRQVFALSRIISERLRPGDAANLSCWMADRLQSRVRTDEHEFLHDVPSQMAAALGRFLYSYMGDVDVRLRWSAVHALRQLIKLGDRQVLVEMVAHYPNTEEPTFRGNGLPFYWIAARMWLIIALDRLASEVPHAISQNASFLLGVATNEDFPHVLIRAFARDAFQKLIDSNTVVPTEAELAALSAVNTNNIPRRKRATREQFRTDFNRQGQRFRFDAMDTLPYWYRPMLRAFSDVSESNFVKIAEGWIVDEWHAKSDISAWAAEPRKNRIAQREYQLWSNRQGELPVLERWNTHLEWHAMWCAAGELLRTEPLSLVDDDWNSLATRIENNQLTIPPYWLSDIVGPRPLKEMYWQAPPDPIENWISSIGVQEFVEEIIPDHDDNYVAVHAHRERRSSGFLETVSVTSALVTPGTAIALVRALQTAGNPMDFCIPPEGDSLEIDDDEYRLIGWLAEPDSYSGIDRADPKRQGVSGYSAVPGQAVTRRFQLLPTHTKMIEWHSPQFKEPVFKYEAWGDREEIREQQYEYSNRFHSSGHRLLIHKARLKEFLCDSKMDLIFEIEVRRSDRGFESPHRQEKATKARYDKIILAKSDGSLKTVAGHLGTWH